jgi:triosephosphate isomerase
MAREAGAVFSLVGHSERRHLFGETDEHVARKVRAARRSGLTPLVCVGETLEERRAGRVEAVILRQLRAALGPLEEGEGRFLVAYEPVWAIGTGETATPADASGAQGLLRSLLDERLGTARSTRVPILYGGSVKPDNAAELMAAPEVDGVLVGGASLEPASWAALVAAAG